MHIDKDTLFKILELIISGSIPLLIFIFGLKVTRKIEDAKNESAKKFYWQTKWTESFFDKYKDYYENVSTLLANLELYRTRDPQKVEFANEIAKLHDEINNLAFKVFREATGLKVQTTTLFGDTAEITKTIENVYSMIAKAINNKDFNLLDIFNELIKLNNITGKIFDESVKNRLINNAHTHNTRYN